MAYRVKYRPKTKGVAGRDGYYMLAERDSGAQVPVGETKKVSGGFEFRGDMLAAPFFRRTLRELQETLAADADVAAFVAGRSAARAPAAGRGTAAARAAARAAPRGSPPRRGRRATAAGG